MKIAEYLDIPLTERSGGVGTYVKSVSKAIERLGHKVVIIEGTHRPKFLLNRHLIRICKDADIHHLHEPSTTLLNFMIHEIFGQVNDLVITFHAPIQSRLLNMPYSLIARLQFLKARLILTSTKRNAEYLRSMKIRAYTAPLWADKYFKPADKARYVRERYVLSVCVCDKFHNYKNFLMLSKIGKLIGQKFGVSLIHVGIHDFNIPYVKHYGVVDKGTLRQLYQKALALVLPSTGLYEGFGLVAAEAMACATPVLVSDCCGISDFLDGYFVSPLASFENRLCSMIDSLLREPRPIIDKVHQESSKFDYKNCRDTVELILSSARKA